MHTFSLPFGKEKIKFELPEEQVAASSSPTPMNTRRRNRKRNSSPMPGQPDWQPEIKRIGKGEEELRHYFQ